MSLAVQLLCLRPRESRLGFSSCALCLNNQPLFWKLAVSSQRRGVEIVNTERKYIGK